MTNQLVAMYCPKCGGQLEEFFGTSGTCPNCKQVFKVEFGNPEMQELSDEVDLGVGALAQMKGLQNRTARDDWELEKEKRLFHSQEGTKECGCGAINPQSAKFCMECGQSFGQTTAYATPGQPTVTYHFSGPPVQKTHGSRKICLNCGTGNAPDAAFCGGCGQRYP